MTPYETVFTHLKSKGFKVYTPANKNGECLEPYIVIKLSGTTKVAGLSITVNIVDIMCYVPQKNYSKLYGYKESVKAALGELNEFLKPLHIETPDFYEEEIKAHMTSVQYQLYRPI